MTEALTNFLISFISSTGYWGVFILMGIGTAAIPIPSEVVMVFAGAQAVLEPGTLNYWLIILAGTIGTMIGAYLTYWLGLYGGRPLVEKYGKYILISHNDLGRAERFFQKYGEITVLFGRLIPFFRAYVSFPAGIVKMPFGRFSAYSVIGSFVWAWFLTWLGIRLGSNWQLVQFYFRKFDILIIAILIILIGLYIYRHLKVYPAKLQ